MKSRKMVLMNLFVGHRVIFLFEFRMGHKTAETSCNVNNAFGPGTAHKHTEQWWFNKFCKGDQALEDEEHSDGH